jgi:hypothetical protein
VASFEAVAHQAVEFGPAQPGEPPRQPCTEQRTGKTGKLESLAQSRLRRHGAQRAQIDGMIGSGLEARHAGIVSTRATAAVRGMTWSPGSPAASLLIFFPIGFKDCRHCVRR